MGALWSLINAVLIIISWPVSLFFMTFIHEAGHVLMYRIFFREKDWHITLGTGKPVIKLKKLTVNAWFFTRGYINCRTMQKGGVLKPIMMCAGGPLASMGSAVLLWFLMQAVKVNGLSPEWFNINSALSFMWWVCVSQAVLTMIPMKYPVWPYKGTPSDGMRIKELIAAKSTTT